MGSRNILLCQKTKYTMKRFPAGNILFSIVLFNNGPVVCSSGKALFLKIILSWKNKLIRKSQYQVSLVETSFIGLFDSSVKTIWQEADKGSDSNGKNATAWLASIQGCTPRPVPSHALPAPQKLAKAVGWNRTKLISI